MVWEGIGIVDYSHYMYKSFFSFWNQKFPKVDKSRPLSGLIQSTNWEIFGDMIFESILDSLNKLKPQGITLSGIVFCLDASQSEARNNLYPDYKSGRGKYDKYSEDFLSKRKEIFKYLEERIKEYSRTNEHSITLSIHGYEADDLIWVMSKTLLSGHKKAILSFDSDLWQLIDHNTIFIGEKSNKMKILTMENFSKESVNSTFKEPFDSVDDYLLTKILAGDKSDNISGVSGIGDTTAYKLVKKYKTLKNMIQRTPINHDIKIVGEKNKLDYINTPKAMDEIKLSTKLIKISFVANNSYLKQQVIEQYNQQVEV